MELPVRIENIPAKAAPAIWAGSGLVFLDPVLMRERQVIPGLLARLCSGNASFPVRLGFGMERISGTGQIHIDGALLDLPGWHELSRVSLEVDETYDEVVSVAVEVDSTQFLTLDRGAFIKRLRLVAFPVKSGYRLISTQDKSQIVFTVLATTPPKGGVIGRSTEILLGEGELTVFREVSRYQREFEQFMARIEQLKRERQTLRERLRFSADKISQFSNIGRELDRIRAASTQLAERVEQRTALSLRQLEKIKELKDQIQLYTGKYQENM